jgi:hypothetical protein
LHWRAVWVFLVVFTAACMFSGFQFTIRHLLFPVVLLVLLLAPLPRTLMSLGDSESPRRSGFIFARAGIGLTIALALASVATAVRAYPYYLPFLNSLSAGRPGYALVSDSNLDWNQAFPDVEGFVRQHGLKHVLIDEYGYSEPDVYVPGAQVWNCQRAVPEDGGQWAAVSANMIEDSHNCLWLLGYPHQALAGGSMFAFQLPAVIPPAGSPGGPPLPADYHDFAGLPYALGDIRFMFLKCIRDPQQLQPTWDEMAKTRPQPKK